MKYLTTLLLVLTLAGCATTSKPPETLIVRDESSPLPLATGNDLRNPEITKSYDLGRYEDATGVMHEKGPAYRVEQDATWNNLGTYPPQRTAPSVVMTGPTTIDTSAKNAPPINPELEQKLVQQEHLIQALVEQTQVMARNVQTTSQRSTDLQNALNDVAKLRLEMEQTKAAIEKEKLDKAKAAPPQPRSWWDWSSTSPLPPATPAQPADPTLNNTATSPNQIPADFENK